MRPPSILVRLAVLASSLTLLTCYVVYSHQSAQMQGAQAGEALTLEHAITQTSSVDPIAALAASDSRAHQMQPALTEKPMEGAQPPGSVESIWQSPLSPRILSARGHGLENSGRTVTPEKLADKYFTARAAERMIMAGSKSARVFTPPPVPPRAEPSSDVALFHLNSVVQNEILMLPPLPGNITVQPNSLPAPLPDLLEQPQNIQRILADDGHSLDESRKNFAPEKIAEAVRYKKYMNYSGSSLGREKLENPVSALYWPLVRLLMPQPPQQSLFQNTP